MTRLLRLSALLVSATAAACGFDLTAVELRRHPILSVDLSVQSAGALRGIVRFHPGFDGSGHPRAVRDESLRMNGIAIAPVETTQRGERLYEVAVTDTASELHFEPPAPADLGEQPPEVVVYRVAPASLDTLSARRDGSIRIAITGLDRIDPAGLTGSWNLDVYPDACAGSRLISLSGHTAPPRVLELPVALLPQDLHAGHVLVHSHLVQDASVSGGIYEILIRSRFVSCIPFRIVP